MHLFYFQIRRCHVFNISFYYFSPVISFITQRKQKSAIFLSPKIIDIGWEIFLYTCVRMVDNISYWGKFPNNISFIPTPDKSCLSHT